MNKKDNELDSLRDTLHLVLLTLFSKREDGIAVIAKVFNSIKNATLQTSESGQEGNDKKWLH